MFRKTSTDELDECLKKGFVLISMGNVDDEKSHIWKCYIPNEPKSRENNIKSGGFELGSLKGIWCKTRIIKKTENAILYTM